MLRKFQDIEVGTRFTFNGIEYLKINNERVNCCSTNNAVNTSDANQKTHIPETSEVEIND